MDQAVTIVIAVERLSDQLWDELNPLLLEHWQEVAQFKDIPLAPDIQKYNALDVAGVLKLYTVRVSGALVGYAIFVVGQSLHYVTSKVAQCDVIFLKPEYRRGSLGVRRIAHTEGDLKAQGVDVLRHHAKIEHPVLGRLLDARGYIREDIIYARRL